MYKCHLRLDDEDVFKCYSIQLLRHRLCKNTTCADGQFPYHYKQINNCNYENNNETNGHYNDNIIGVEKNPLFVCSCDYCNSTQCVLQFTSAWCVGFTFCNREHIKILCNSICLTFLVPC